MAMNFRSRLKASYRNIMFRLSANNNFLFIAYYRYFFFPEPGTLDHFTSEYSRLNKGLTVVQVGANDGFNADPIHKYIKRDNWRGVLVEPLPDVFSQRLEPLYRKHKDIVTLNAAITAEEGSRPIYRIAFSNSRWATGLTSFNRDTLESAIKSGYVERNTRKEGISMPASASDYIKEEVVRCITPSTLLKECGIEQIDWLQIDTEGLDYEVLKGFISAGAKPKVIVYENSHMDAESKIECRNLLLSLGYMARDFGRDTLAATELTDRLDLFFTLEE